MVSEPSFVANAGVYIYHFREEMVNVRIDRIYDKRDTVTAEATVATDAPGQIPFLHQARLNLLSTSSRKALSKYLNTRYELVDWDGLLEIVCVLTIRKYREGEPLQTIGALPPRSGQTFRLSPILMEAEPTLIFGAGGTGKSYLACFFALLVQTGESCCGLTPKKGNILYLDFETSPEEIDERIKALKLGLSISGETNILYRRGYQALASDIETIQRIVLDNNIEMIVIDSMGGACGGEPESAEIVLKYFMALRSLKITVLNIDHVAKNAVAKTPFGSVYKTNSSRSVWELRQTQEVGEDRMNIGLFHRKANRGRLHKPLGYEITFFDDQAVLIQSTDIRDIPELSSGMPLQDQIAEILKHGAMTIKEIASEINANSPSVRATLYRHKNRFVIADTAGKKWGLLTRSL